MPRKKAPAAMARPMTRPMMRVTIGLRISGLLLSDEGSGVRGQGSVFRTRHAPGQRGAPPVPTVLGSLNPVPNSKLKTQNSKLKTPYSLVAQGDDGVEAGGAARRVDAEEEPDRQREADRQQRRPRRDHRRDDAGQVDQLGDADADAQSQQPPG